MLLARRENYAVTFIERLVGRIYQVTMNNEHYQAVVLVHSFQFYTLRYHLAAHVPTLVICFEHDTVLPVKCLSLLKGNLARPYELPEDIDDLRVQRRGKTGSQVLLGMYVSGVRAAQE